MTISTKAGDDQRLMRLHTELASILLEDGCEAAVIEDLPAHAQSAGLTGMAQGVVRLTLLALEVPFVTVPPATLKKFATGKGNATKADMRMAWFQRAGEDVRDDNQVDALWLRQVGLHLLSDSEALLLPQTHTTALSKLGTFQNLPESESSTPSSTHCSS